MKRRLTLHQLRKLTHPKELHGNKAFQLAEQQAYEFLRLAECEAPSDITDAIAALPRFRIDIVPDLPSSGSSEWSDGHWQILLNGSEPPVRQRFSLAHELKHILDHPFQQDHPAAYSYQSESESSERRRQTEAICDYFAGCLLVPRPWLEHDWATGHRDVNKLAMTFGVSRQAMMVRLDQAGLKPAQGRHRTVRSLNRVFGSVGQRGRRWGSSLRHRSGRRYYRALPSHAVQES